MTHYLVGLVQFGARRFPLKGRKPPALARSLGEAVWTRLEFLSRQEVELSRGASDIS